jgi:hypothetical protein
MRHNSVCSCFQDALRSALPRAGKSILQAYGGKARARASIGDFTEAAGSAPRSGSGSGLPTIQALHIPGRCGVLRDSSKIKVLNTPASMMLPPDTDQKACAHTNRLLMTGHEVVVVSRFQIPTKTVFAIGPEHEVSADLTRD